MMGIYFRKGVLYLLKTWISFPGETPDDFPEYFTTEDMEGAGLEPDYYGMAKAENQKREIQRWFV